MTADQTPAPAPTRTAGLAHTLRRRHMAMIAIGGSVGAGLFIGSGAVINAAGPAAILSYALAGALVLLTLRALGEMVVARPAAGSFSDYARMALGPRAGFCIGWLYWWMYSVLVAAEAVAGAATLAGWVPLPGWLLSLLLLLVMTGANLVSARAFGETESLFSLIKVATIVAFLIMGGLFALGMWPGAEGSTVDNLWAHGGFAPNGWGAVLAATVVVLFSFGGVEIVTIAAGESAEPERNVARAATNVLWRIALFYVASILVVVVVLPWDTAEVLESPFVSVMQEVGVPGAPLIMEVVVFVAVLSVLNAALYTSSRMLHVLTRQGDAPRGLSTVGRRGVPTRAILLGTAVGYASVIGNYVWPTTVFPFLVASIGAILLVLFITIVVSQLVLGRRLRRQEPERLTFRMWGFPYVSWAVLAGLLSVMAAMALLPEQRLPLAATLGALAVTLVAYELRRRLGRTPVTREPLGTGAPAESAGSAADGAGGGAAPAGGA
ncbi:GABA permease [Streptomonospora nanhaiensis]|uniref:GABA permease n=2 Tax=Streptomonospora nanhaiensis TaxID=1323731 RepID=A0A853BFX1_9ACTN|nr:GABA permease [Streptomonospora nanhaiensis]